jgi:hypothetical protein
VIELSLPALVESSDDRFFFSVKDLDRMKEGRETCCRSAHDVRHSTMRAEGLCFLTANFTSEVEISRLSSSSSNAPSAKVMGFHLSETCAKIACSKSVICDVMTLCNFLTPSKGGRDASEFAKKRLRI